jgi:hypothetical protein
MGSSQPGGGGLGHRWETYMKLKLFQLLACFSVVDGVKKDRE